MSERKKVENIAELLKKKSPPNLIASIYKKIQVCQTGIQVKNLWQGSPKRLDFPSPHANAFCALGKCKEKQG